jgi:hypothetical protein
LFSAEHKTNLVIVHARVLVIARSIVAVLERRDVAHDELRALLASLLDVLMPGDAERPGGIVDGDQTLPLLDGNGYRVVQTEPLRFEFCQTSGSRSGCTSGSA